MFSKMRILLALALITSVAGSLLPQIVAAAPPAAAHASAVAVSGGEVDVTWSGGLPPTASSVAVSRSGKQLASINGKQHLFVDTSVEPGTKYTYNLDAQDGHGKKLGLLASVNVRTPDSPERPDVTPPGEPEGFSATPAAAGGVYLDWYPASDDSNITAYRIFRNGDLLVTVDGATLSYTDTTAAPGQSYDYSLQTFDVVGHHSDSVNAHVSVPAGNAPSTRTSGATQSDGTASLESVGSPNTLALLAAGYNSALRRYPYLTDTVAQFATVNWATDQSGTVGSVKYGQVVNGACTPSISAAATRTNFTVNGVPEYQWKAQLTLLPDTQYCYRVYLGSTDLLGTDSTPQFKTQVSAGTNQSFSFAVIGDWAEVDSNSANPDMANLMQKISTSGARFAVTVGDNSYPSGTQDNYGDLQQTGANISGVFGPQFWTVPGRSIPMFAAVGNHGFSSSAAVHPQILNFPESQASALSSGSYSVGNYCCLNNITPSNYPNTWYAFDAGLARFYVLEAAWPDQNVGTASNYQNDHDFHWTISSDEYKWLQQDLASHPRAVKFAFFHFPMYSDNATEPADPFLRAPGNLQGLLDQYGVNISFFGHSHIYQRNTADSAGMVSYLTGGGGAKLEPVGTGSAPCSSNDAYALGWSYSANGGLGAGTSCGAAKKPTSPSQVFHYLLVTVANGTITVTPTNAAGGTFDVKSYKFNTNDTTVPSTPTNLSARAVGPTEVDLTWTKSTDNKAVAGYDVYRNGIKIATLDSSVTSFADLTVVAGTTYTYTVDAYDAAGNHSAKSTGVTVTPAADSTPPSVPSNLNATASSSLRVDLSWTASTDGVAVSGYDIYRNSTLLVSGVTQTTFADVQVDPGTTYNYQVLARDTSGNTSALSTTASATTSAAIFSDGFESGDLSKWTTKNGLTVQGTVVHSGSDAAEALSDANNTTGTYAKKTLPSTYSDGYVRAYINVQSIGNNQANMLRLRAADGTSLGYLYITSTGTLGLHNDTTGTNITSPNALSPGSGWHALELHLSVNGASSTTEVWLDGVLISNLSVTADWGTAAIGQIQIGDTATARTYDVVYDDVAFAGSLSDATPPSVPANVKAMANSAIRVDVTWSAATDNVAVAGYDVYRNGTLLAGGVTTTSFTDVQVDPSSTYSYQVLARDSSGNTSVLSQASVTTTANATFSDGFETGDLSKWTTKAGLVVETTVVNSGTNAAEGNATITGNYAKKTLSTQLGEGYFRTQVNLLSTSNQIGLLWFRDAAGNVIGYLYVTAAGTLAIHNQTTGLNTTSTSSLSPGSGWHALEIHLTINGANSSTEVWLDGAPVNGLSMTADFGTAPIGQIQIGDTTTNRTYDVVYDDVVFDMSRVDRSAPSVPDNLTATASAVNQVDLSWAASTDDVGVTGYTIYRDGTVLATVDGSTTSYSDTTGQPSTTYSYTVDAFDAAGNHSAQSTPSPATTLDDTTAPSVPANLTANTISGTQINLSWSAATDDVGVAGYTIYRDGTQIDTVGGTATSYSDTTVQSGTTYSYTIDAFDAAGNHSAQSDPVTAQPPDVAAPSTPTNLATTVSDKIDLSWTASNDNVGVTGYTVYRDGTALATVDGSTTSYSDTTVTPAKTYSYTVDAFDAAGNHSPQSAPATGMVPDTAPPSTPVNLQASAIAATQVKLTWSASTDNAAVAGYTIYRDGTKLTTVNGSTTTYTDATAKPVTTYSYTVDAFDASGNFSSQSAPSQATTPPDTTPPSVPLNLSASTPGGKVVNLSWSASTDNVGVVGYTIYRDGVKLTTVSGTTTSYTDTTVALSTNYTYTVDAFDAAGNHSAQSSKGNVRTKNK